MLKRKKVLSLTLMICLTLPLTAFGNSTEYLRSGTPAEMNVSDTVGLEKREVTRGQFISMLAEASGDDIEQHRYKSHPFTDVKDNDAAVGWAYDKWLINGNGSGRFHPEDSMSRQEAAAILGRYLDYRYTDMPAGCGTGLPDMTHVAEWARKGVSACRMYGIIPADADASFTGSDGIHGPDFRSLDKVTISDARQWIENVRTFNVSAVRAPEKRTFADNLTFYAGEEAEDENWSVSPYSAQMALAMLTSGAKGRTKDELQGALQIENIDGFSDSVENLLKKYDGFQEVMALETANSIWLNQSWFGGKGTFLPDYQKKMEKKYRAEAKEVTNDNSVEEVNAWVKEKTKGKIPTILTEDNREFVTALVNTVYFKGAWANEFQPNNTEKGVFYNADGSRGQADFMNQTDYFGYYSTPGVEAVKLDYRKYKTDDGAGTNMKFFRDADFSMYLIKADDKNADLQNILDQAEFENTRVRLSVPKFKVEYGTQLDDALKAMGVKTAYDRVQSDFSAIVDPAALPEGQYFLDTVLQKSYIAVDEKGTEAAAVTAAVDGAGSPPPPEREPLVREFIADEPFYFVIRDNEEKIILFAGQYNMADA